jgi:hypothetical protein
VTVRWWSIAGSHFCGPQFFNCNHRPGDLAHRLFEAGQSVCRLLPGHLLLALLLTLAAAITAAVLGGARVARMEPSSGLRSL